MSLLSLVSQIKSTQKKTPESTSDTEFILPYALKRDVLCHLENISLPESPKDSDMRTLGFALSVLNEYTFYDPILLRIFSYLCEHTPNKEELTKRLAVKHYLCTDVVPQPFYQTIKDHIAKQGKVLGDYAYCDVYVAFMIGKVIAFALVRSNKIVSTYSDSDVIQKVFRSKCPPTIQW